MFEKIGRLAEAAANNVSVSRRGFLARLGQSALGVVGVMAGLTATAASAKGGSYVCCMWKCKIPTNSTVKSCYPAGTNCYALANPCPYSTGQVIQKTVNSCSGCK